jgi:putative addiction module component (TIGR02574 family)
MFQGYTCRMTKQALELLQKALALPEADRAALAGSLLESLDQVVDADAELAWKNEIARRISDLDSGKAKTVPWEELRSRLAARLENGK